MRYLSSAAIGIAILGFITPVFGQPLTVPPGGIVEVTEQRVDRTHYYYTFSGVLVNTGPALAGVTATLTSLAPNVSVVPGQGSLHFSPVPAGSAQSPAQVTSRDTFTVLVDRSQSFDFSAFSWSFTAPFANPGPNQNVAVLSTVTLNGGGSTNPSGIGTLTYSWAFTSTPATSHATITNANSTVATFTVDVPGTYMVKLTVNNGTSSDSAVVSISTVNSPPVANAGANQTVTVGQVVTLDGTKSSDPDGDPLTYNWSFVSVPSGSSAILSNPRSATPSFTVDKAGSFIAGLVVNDGNFSSTMSTVVITTGNTPPVAVATAQPSKATPFQIVQLSAANSTDVNGDTLTFQWSLNLSLAPGSKATLSNPNIVNPTFIPDVPGTYIAQVIAFDGQVPSLPATVTISTNTLLPPTVNAGGTQKVNVGATVQLAGTATDPQSLPLTYTWSMLSKPAGSKASLSATNILNPTFLADYPGTYTAQLIAYNGTLYSNSMDPASIVTITSTNVPPVASPQTSTPNASVGIPVTLDGSHSTDPDGLQLSYSWSLQSVPAGSHAAITGGTTAFATFTPDVIGTYVAQLIVSDTFASSTPKTVSVTASVNGITMTPNPMNIGTNGSGTLTITIAPPAGSSPVTVTLSGYDTNVITLGTNSINVPANSSTATVSVTPVGPGSTTVNATASGYQSGSSTVNVLVPTITLSMDNNATGVGLTHSLNGTITLNLPAPSPITVNLSNDASSTGQVSFNPTPVTIPMGSTTGTFTLTGTQIGSVTVNAAAVGYRRATYALLVSSLGSITVNLNTGLSVQPGQSVALNVKLSSPAPADGVTVNLGSSDTTVLTVTPSSVFIAAGATSPATAPQVNGIKPGSATVSATSGGFTDGTQSVSVIATVSFSTQAVSVGAGGVQSFNILLSAPAPTGGLNVTLTPGDSSVATVSSPVFISGGNSSGSAQITGGNAGSTNITATTSSQFYSATGASLSVTVVTVLTMTCPAVTTGEVGLAFSSPAPTVTGGTGPYAFSLASGALPSGLSLNTATGAVTGTPGATGSFTIQVKDSKNAVAATTCPISIVSAPTVACSASNSGEVQAAFSSAAPTITGGVSPFTFAVSSGTLPAGLTLNTSSGAITGTPQAAGTFNIQAKDALGATATPTCGFTIVTAPTVTCPQITSAEVGVGFTSQAPTVTGGTSPYTFSVVGSLPQGLSLDSSTGIVSGTASATGSFSIQVKDAKNVTGTPSCTFNVVPGPTVSCTAANGEVGVAYNGAAPAVTNGVTPYTFSVIGTLPAGLTLNSSTGAVTGTPQVAGSFSIQVKDAAGATGSATCSVTIANGPSVSSCPNTQGEAGVAFSSPAIAVTGGTAPYTFSVSSGSLPAGLSLNASTGAVTGTPSVTGSFTLQVKDSLGSTASVTCPFTIAPGPSLTCPLSTTGEQGLAFSSPAMTVTGGASPYTFSVSVGSLPSGLSLNASTGAITGTPNATGTFTIQVKDSMGAVATTTCTFTINPGPTPTCPNSTTGEQGVAFSSPAINVANGVSPFTFTVATGSLPAGLALNSSTGAITGTPGVAGSFTLQVKDSAGATAAVPCTFTINTAPTATCPGTTSGEAGAAFTSGPITVTGGTSPYTYSVVGTLPTGLTLNTSTGVVTGTPQAAGTFSVQAKDAMGATATPSCTFTIITGPVMTCPGSTSGEVGLAFNSGTPTVTGGTTPYTFSVVGTLPAGLSLNSSTGAVTGTPSANGSFTLQVKDAKSVAATTTCTITIANGPTATCPQTTPGEVGVAFNAAAIAVSGGVGPYTFAVVGTLPAGLTLNTSTGAITGTPQAAGSFSVQAKDSNNIVATPSCTYTIVLAVTLACPQSTTAEVGVAFSSPALTVSNGTGPYTFSVVGTLPTGLSLNTSTGAITGTPQTAGSFSVQVKDANNVVATTTCAFTVVTGPSMTCPQANSGEQGVAFSSPAITVSNGVGPFTFSVLGTLPAGLSLNTSTGAISGTPSANGTFNVQVKDSNNVTAASPCAFTIAAPPTATCPNTPNGEQGVAFSSGAITVTGGVGPYTFAIVGTLPAGLSLNTSTGAVTGTPTASGSFNVQAKDANGIAATPNCALTIVSPPTATCAAATSGEVGIAFNSGAITLSGGVGPFTFSITNGTLPAGLSLNTSTGAITGTPTASGAFQVQAKDANGVTATPLCSINIVAGPSLTCPTTTPGEQGIAFSSPAMTVTGGVGPYTFSVVGTLPAGLSLNTTSGAVSGTPSANGSFTIQVKDSNGAAATTTCPFIINPPPSLTCPASLSGSVGTAMNSPAMTVTGGTAPYTFSVSAGTLPAGLSLNSSTGAITGTPSAGGSFTVQVKDAQNVTASTTCTFTIANNVQITTQSLPSGLSSTAYTFTLAASGGKSPYTWTPVSLPSWLSLSSTGTLSGTPRSAFTYTVTVQVSDSTTPTAQTAQATFQLVVTNPPLQFTTAAQLPGATINVPYSQPITIQGGTPPYNWAATPGQNSFLAFDLSGQTCGQSGPSICGTPTALGTFTITIQVIDSANPATTIIQAFSVQVTPKGGLGTITVAGGSGGTSTFKVGTNLQVPVTITFNPAPPQNIQLTIASSAAGVLSLGGNGQIAGSNQLTVTVLANTQTIATFANGLAPGSANITVTASTGYSAGSASATVGNSGFVIQSTGIGSSVNTFQNVQTTLTVYPALLDANGLFVEAESVAGGLSETVPFIVSPLSAGSLSPAFLTFNGGDSNQQIVFKAATSFVGGASVSVVQPSGFTTPNATQTTINFNIQASGMTAPSLTIGKNLQVSTAIQLSGNAAQDISVTVSTSDPNLMFAIKEGDPGSSTITVVIPQNQIQSKTFWVRGYSNTGTGTYTASANGLGTAQGTVVHAPSGLVIQVPGGSFGGGFTIGKNSGFDATLTIWPAALDSQGNIIATEEVAADQSISGTVSTGNNGVGNISGPACTPPVTGVGCITLAGMAQNTTATFHPIAAGTTSITASATGYGSGSASAAVTSCVLTINNALTVGMNLAAQGTVILSCPAPTGGLQVTLTSQSSNLLLAANASDAGGSSVTITVPAGSPTGTFYAFAKASSGSGTYSASANNYTSNGNDTVAFAPSGIAIFGAGGAPVETINSTGGPQTLTVYTYQLKNDGSNGLGTQQPLAGFYPGGQLPVAVANDNNVVGSISANSVNIPAGQSQATLTFTPVAGTSGTADVSVTQPSGFTAPAPVLNFILTRVVITVQ